MPALAQSERRRRRRRRRGRGEGEPGEADSVTLCNEHGEETPLRMPSSALK
jgi:hypothetical protein